MEQEIPFLGDQSQGKIHDTCQVCRDPQKALPRPRHLKTASI